MTAGKTYRLKERLPQREAVVIEEAGAGQIVAQGALVDIFAGCIPKPPRHRRAFSVNMP